MKVKPIVFAIFYLMPILAGYSQVTWFPTGAKWHYEYSSMLGGGLTTLKVLDVDTLIGSNPYKRILSTTIWESSGSIDTFIEILYVFEENQVVYGFDRWLGGTLLYDFNKVVDDTIGIYFGGFSPYPFIVDSIGEIEINGNLFKFQDIRFPNLFEPGEFYEMRVIEGLGSINSHLFHDHTVIQPFDFPFYYFRCYEDPNIGLINLSYNQVDCDYIEGITSITEATKVTASVFPNPTNDFVTVRTKSQFIHKLCVVDILGNVRIIKNGITQGDLNVDIGELENGIFYLIAIDKNGNIILTEKISKYGS